MTITVFQDGSRFVDEVGALIFKSTYTVSGFCLDEARKAREQFLSCFSESHPQATVNFVESENTEKFHKALEGFSIVRTCHDSGEKHLATLDFVKENLQGSYVDIEMVIRELALGHPIRCSFATYQHRDWVPGFERESQEKENVSENVSEKGNK